MSANLQHAGDFQKVGWMRAARTDKGVSAVGQCVSLRMMLEHPTDERDVIVRINERLTNLGCRMHSGLYRPPRNHSVGSHFVKSAGGMEYVWGLLVNGDKHNVTKCHIMTGDYRL